MNMDIMNSTLEYGRELVHSGLEGARTARDNNLHGKRVGTVLGECAQSAVVPALVGASVGLLVAFMTSKPRKVKALALGVTGALVGFGTSMAWNTRDLTGNMAKGAASGISSARDAHWLKKNPVCYG